eukprot:GGOE01056843.1.p1 GENE.GGOE01056843.1~~GGOE01056843.1.p1  ORF type:complete len:278 (+),score=42.04 GGOE01056843.1:127-960(+)
MFSGNAWRFVVTSFFAMATSACLVLAFGDAQSSTNRYATPAINLRPMSSIALPRMAFSNPVVALALLEEVDKKELQTNLLNTTPPKKFSIRSLTWLFFVPIGALMGFFVGRKLTKMKRGTFSVLHQCDYTMMMTLGAQVEKDESTEKLPVKVETSYAKIIANIEKKYMKEASSVPNVQVGDTVTVGVHIQEGETKRVQDFTGVILRLKNSGLHKSMSVRAVMEEVAVERIFMLHSPFVAYIKILRRAKVRRAKLYYLRNVVGKAARLKPRFDQSVNN